MAEKRVLIAHKDDPAGTHRYSVPAGKVDRLYPSGDGWKVTGEESSAAFELQGIVAPKAARPAPRAKGSRRPVARPVARIPEPETPKPSEVIDKPVAEA